MSIFAEDKLARNQGAGVYFSLRPPRYVGVLGCKSASKCWKPVKVGEYREVQAGSNLKP